MNHVMVGFGFGPIQAGLFTKEASERGSFDRITIAEIDAELVNAVRRNGNSFALNIAHGSDIERVEVRNVQLLNPVVPDDAVKLAEALAEATEIVTSLPSVANYEGAESGPSSLIANGLRSRDSQPALIYAAENNNRAAEILSQKVARDVDLAGRPVQFVNTVIGKMSRTVFGASEISEFGLAPIAPGLERAFLVEEFHHILVEKCTIQGFALGIEAFEEKEDLLPFEEAKLFGHNAVHVLIGFLGKQRGLKMMSEAGDDEALATMAREAFLLESGRALIHRHSGKDELFTERGFEAYADDLLQRMYNPNLRDSVERVARDPLRKLGWNDRLIGTIRIALEAGIEPARFIAAAKAALEILRVEGQEDVQRILMAAWREETQDEELLLRITNLITRR